MVFGLRSKFSSCCIVGIIVKIIAIEKSKASRRNTGRLFYLVTNYESLQIYEYTNYYEGGKREVASPNKYEAREVGKERKVIEGGCWGASWLNYPCVYAGHVVRMLLQTRPP